MIPQGLLLLFHTEFFSLSLLYIYISRSAADMWLRICLRQNVNVSVEAEGAVREENSSAPRSSYSQQSAPS